MDINSLANEILSTAQKAAEDLEAAGKDSEAKSLGTVLLFVKANEAGFLDFLKSI